MALNREVDEQTAAKLNDIFLEIVIAPSFTEQALDILTRKKNIRLLTVDFQAERKQEPFIVSVRGGLLVQDEDTYTIDDATLQVVTERKPTEEEWANLTFAWRVVKHVKSNAIVLAKTE